MKTLLLLCIIIIFAITHSSGQRANKKNKAYSVLKFSPLTPRGYLNLTANDFKEQSIAPFKMKKKQFMHFGIFCAATAVLVISDPNVDAYARKLDNYKLVRKVSPFITNFGSNYGIYTVGALELTGLIFKDKKLVTSGILASQAMITSGIYTWIGKIGFSRSRPSVSYGTRYYCKGGPWHGAPDYFDSWSDTKKVPGAGYDAMPSGHTSMAFSIATVYAMMYKDHLAVPVFSYTMASLIGLSRMTEHAHWGSDVFVGAALGYLCGRQVVNNYEKLSKIYTKRHKHKDISVSLNYSENKYLAGFNYKF